MDTRLQDLGRRLAGRWTTEATHPALPGAAIAGTSECEWLAGERFLIYIEQVLAPTLARGDLVVMDNLGSHKAKAVRHALRRAGAKLLFLPKYPLDLNPVEQFFAKLKHRPRRDQPRSRDAVCHAIATALDTVTDTECSNHFAHAGYGSTYSHPALTVLRCSRYKRRLYSG